MTFILVPSKFWMKDEAPNLIMCCLLKAIAHLSRWWQVSIDQWWNYSQKGDIEKLWDVPAVAPLGSPQNSREFTKGWTRDSVARVQRSTACVVAWSYTTNKRMNSAVHTEPTSIRNAVVSCFSVPRLFVSVYSKEESWFSMEPLKLFGVIK
jgi:hypothetical protein